MLLCLNKRIVVYAKKPGLKTEMAEETQKLDEGFYSS